MSELDIIRAWKDRTYRNSLSADELAQLPEHPAGAIELTDDELTNVDGAASPVSIISVAASATLSLVTVVTSLTYLSYRLGTNGSAASCCPCKPAAAAVDVASSDLTNA